MDAPQHQGRAASPAANGCVPLPGRISVVIPVWRENAGLRDAVAMIGRWPEVQEVIVVSADDHALWRHGIEAAGARFLTTATPSRGAQSNLGAQHARGEWLLFHHADTALTRAHIQSLHALGTRPEIVGGAFYRKFDERHPHCRWLEPAERWRNRRFGALYGDQSLFVRRAHFQRLGGFADIPLMEDFEFSHRLRASGPLALLDPPIASSPRRHLRRGAWRTTLENASLILLYRLGVPPARLHAWYYGRRATSPNPATPPHENQTHPPAHRTPAAAEAPR